MNISTKLQYTLRTLAIALVLFSTQVTIAQIPLQVDITVLPPYPTQYNVWVSNVDNYMITVSNNSDTEFEYYLDIEMIGLTHAEPTFIKLLEGSRPIQGRRIGAGEVQMLTQQDIEEMYDGLDIPDLDISPNIPLEENGELPAGDYQLCTTAINFDPSGVDDGIQLSPKDCSDPFLVSHNNLSIAFPEEGDIMPEVEDTPFPIAWIVNGNSLANDPYEYILRLYEIEPEVAAEEPVWELVEEGTLPVFFETAELITNAISYDENEAYPPMTPGNMYAAQIEISSYTEAFFDNDKKSQVVTFWYGFDGSVATEVEEEEVDQAEECFQNCYYTELDNNSAVANEGLTTMEIGHFTITDVEDLSASGNLMSGTGKINIPFLNDVYVNVEFDNVQVNSQGRIFDGTVNAVKDELYDETEMTPSIAEDFNTMIRNTRLVAGLAGADASMGLPLGLVQNISGYNVLVGFTEMSFTEETANCKLVNNLHIPSMGEEAWVSMVGSDICLTPSGFANEFTIHPGTDIHIASEGDISIDFKGSENLNERSCFFKMDCEGVKEIQLSADIFFPESMLLKENPTDGTILYSTEADAENRVKALLDINIDRVVGAESNIYAAYGEEGIPEENGIHFIADATLDSPFQIKGVDGWGFEVTNIVVDASEIENSSEVSFPESYQDNGEDVDESWTGFYMETLSLSTPPAFMGGDDRSVLTVHDLIIDPQLTLKLAVGNEDNPVIGINEGEVDKWSFSLEEIFIEIVQNRFESGGLNGEVGLPISEEGNFIEYSAIISDSDTSNDEIDPLEYVFTMSPADEFNVPLLLAQVNLHESSYIKGGINPSEDQATYFELYAAGGMGIQSDLFNEGLATSILPIETNLISFDLKYHSKDGLTRHNMGFIADFEIETYDGNYIPAPNDLVGDGPEYGDEHNEESFNGFPFGIINMGLTNDAGGAPGDLNFMIQPEINLTSGESAISADAVLNFPSSITSTSSGNRIKVTGFTISEVGIAGRVAGSTISGAIEFYDSQGADGIGLKGARGNLSIELPMGLGMRMEAEFGTDVKDPEAAFNTEDNYPYFYIDGMLNFGENGGIPIAGVVGLYGVGGGFCYNMTRSQFQGDQDAINAQIDAMRAGPSMNPADMTDEDIQSSGVIPTPRWDNYGLKLAVTIGTTPSASLVNADVSIEAEFGINTGLTLVAIRGAGYMMTPLGQREDPSVSLEFDVVYEKPVEGHHIFTGSLDLNIDMYSVLTGSGTAGFYADNGGQGGKGTWYLKLGNTPVEERITVKLGIGDKVAITANGYLLLGHGLPTTLPVPQLVEDLFGSMNSGKGGGLDSQTISGEQSRDQSSVDDAQDGSGLAFGSEVSVNIDVDMLGVYAYLRVCLGFDINITHSPSRTCYIDGKGVFAPGVNGWYGLGQIYAGLEGGMGFRVKAFGKNHDLELFHMAAAMMVSGGGPNPFWAEGRAAISISVLGGLIKCNKSIAVAAGNQCVPYFNDPFGGVPLIVEHWPAHEEKKQSTWTKPKVAFTFPMNEPITIPVFDEEEGTTYNDYLRPSYKNLKLQERDSGDNVSMQVIWNDKGKEMVLVPNENLKAKTWYEVSMRLIAYEYNSSADAYNDINGTRAIDPETNNWWYQDTIFTFKTGKLATLDENIATSIPIRNQRYFLQEDVPLNSTGGVDFIQGAAYEDYFYEEKNGKSYEYTMRFSPMDGSDPIEKDVLNIGNVSTFSIDYFLPELNNSEVYALQLIRRNIVSNDSPLSDLTYAPLEFVLVGNQALNNQISSETSVEFTNQKINPADDLAANEEALLTFFFRTSKYNTFNDKFAGVSTDFDYSSTWDVTINTDEKVDVFDVKGERNEEIPDEDDRKVQDALLKIYDPIDYSSSLFYMVGQPSYTDFYKEVIEDVFVDLLTSYEDKMDDPIENTTTCTIDNISFDNSALDNLDLNGNNNSNNSPVLSSNSESTLPVTSYLPDTWPADDLHFDYSGNPELQMTRKVINYSDPLSESDIDGSWALSGSYLPSTTTNAIQGVIGANSNVQVDVSLWDKVQEDAIVITDWAAELKAIDLGTGPDCDAINNVYGDWIDGNFTKFNNRVDDMSDLINFTPWNYGGFYRLHLYKDKNWNVGDRGDRFKTLDYLVD